MIEGFLFIRSHLDIRYCDYSGGLGMNKQELAAKIWTLANDLRGKVSAATYKDYMLGFLFYKYLSDREEKYLIDKLDFERDEFEEEITEDNEQIKDNCMNNLGYFIAYKNLFSTWVDLDDFSIENVTVALRAFDRYIGSGYKKVFEDIFSTLSTRLTELGTTDPERTKNSREIIKLVKTIPTDNREDYDVLGFIYEYLLKNFAANAGKAGEFYTPHEVSIVMAEIIAWNLKGKEEISIYDPTSGSGSLLINIGQAITKYLGNKNKVKYYAQELIKETYALTRMNLVMRGILPSNIVARQGDTLDKDWPYFENNDPDNTYDYLSVDACCSNPPYSQAWTPIEGPRFKDYGLAPRSKADYAFLLHNLYHLNSEGIMTIVLPHGVLFRGGEEANIRKELVKKHNIETIIGLPANLFYGTGIPTIIMILRKKRLNDDILFIDASKEFTKDGNKNRLRQRDIRKIVDTVIGRRTIPHYSRLVSYKEIASEDNDFNLNIPRYVDSTIPEVPHDLYATMFGGIPNFEIDGDKLKKYWKAFPSLKNDLFGPKNDSYSILKNEDISSVLHGNKEVDDFVKSHIARFSYLSSYLESELLNSLNDIHISSEESKIAESIHSSLPTDGLVDYYDCFEALDNIWQGIVLDLETIREQGIDSAKIVDDVKILKKDSKSKKLEEKIIGREGRVIPFALIQDVYFKTAAEEVAKHENELSELIATKDELLSSIDPNDKSELLKDDSEDIDSKKLTAKIKEIEKQAKRGAIFDEDSYEDIILRINDVNKKISAAKKVLKEEKTKLINKTEDKIVSLTNEEIHSLLKKKWIEPLCNEINSLSTKLIQNLEKEIKSLVKKYETVLTTLDEEIKNTEDLLADMIDDLDADEFDKKGLAELQKLLRGK